VPILLAAFVYLTDGAYVERAVAALVASIVVLVAARRPDRSLLVLIAALPFQGFVLAQLYAWGVPAALVRPLSGWKEALAIGVVVAGVRGYLNGTRRLDRLDYLALAYVTILAAYALVPGLFAPDAPLAGNARSLAFRSSAGFVVLLLATRHARLPSDFLARAGRVLMVVGAVVAAVAVYEYFFSDSWNTFVVEDVQYPTYQVEVLDTPPIDLLDIRRYGQVGGREIIRVGSVFLDPLPCGFFLVLPFSFAVERMLRRGPGGGTAALLVLIGGALVLTQTRAALLGALAVGALAASPRRGRTTSRRVQVALVLAAVVVVALPAAAATGLTERVTSTASGDEPSAVDHVESFWEGVDAVSDRPLGHGIGTSAGTGQRFRAVVTVSENNYLQVGVETGVAAMVAFVALTVVLLRRLREVARTTGDMGVSAVFSAGVGLAIGAFLLHTWSDLSLAWSFWALAGASLAVGDKAAEEGATTATPTPPIGAIVMR
jgi:hypothetical protein